MTGKLVSIEGKRQEKEPRCPFCGSKTVHLDYSCPRIAAVDFYENWEPSRIEFNDIYGVAEPEHDATES